MTREEAIQYLTPINEEFKKQGYNKEFTLAIDTLIANPWHKVSEGLPPVNTEVVCKMKGVPYTEHFVRKWDGKFWWTWNYCGETKQGWFGLNRGWEVVEWKEI